MDEILNAKSLSHEELRQLPVPRLERVLAARREGERQVESLDRIFHGLITPTWPTKPEEDFIDDLIVRAKRSLSLSLVPPAQIEEIAAEIVAELAWARPLHAGAVTGRVVAGVE